MQHEATSTREADRRSLLAWIESAFRNVRLGDGVSLHQALAMDDDWVTQSDVADLRSQDPEERWQDISDEKLQRFSDTLAFMDAEGFRFHIPRFMVFALAHEQSGSFAEFTAIYFSNMREHAGDHLALLSDEQREVIQAFSKFCADEA